MLWQLFDSITEETTSKHRVVTIQQIKSAGNFWKWELHTVLKSNASRVIIQVKRATFFFFFMRMRNFS